MSKAKTKDETADAKPKGGKAKKFLLIGIGAIILLGAGVGAGLYATGSGMVAKHEPEDPNRPKLVKRSEEPAEAGGEGGEGKAPEPKIGTITTKTDASPKEAREYEVTYFPIEQTFTANLSDGSGFVQVGLSLATYFDGKVIANINRQMVPIRSAVLMVLSEQDATVLSSVQGKHELQRKLTDAINHILREKEGFGGIDNVYFTNLVIQ
ncbi:flagellar basal body-associated FliL family protein [Aquisediminimonas sediminicola]|uniref:flagellar basal body-associated FliL family protein n=1 Tax=Alteraquisediminimonas sediminicola TaxID=2676787 RepID=UPI001C8DFA67|nr:flagellar basal body-associated FliL family protein [Aquisediminimonas sediminicola]